MNYLFTIQVSNHVVDISEGRSLIKGETERSVLRSFRSENKADETFHRLVMDHNREGRLDNRNREGFYDNLYLVDSKGQVRNRRSRRGNEWM